MQANGPSRTSSNRLPRLFLILLVLCLGLVLPYLVEQIQYATTRGELRARSEAATAELARLSKSAELVKLSDTSKAFRLVAQRVGPSVVHIDTEQIAHAGGRTAFDHWSLPFPPGPRGYRAYGQGSGVIVDEGGYVLTNYHMIQNASAVEVKLSDGRTISQVEVIGYDVLTDLAVLKIDAGRLTSAEWGDSRLLEVGDWVLAVGNPYGLDRTVTSGIVSAKQRRNFAQFTAYQDFLQTDAAVNPGNSGGPLVNIQGQLVGITTAIVGPAYQGISFAIPTEIARDVYERLKSEGKVARGWLGVSPQDPTPEIAQQLKLPDLAGALVDGVQRGSPAEAAGLLPDDWIIEWNGQKVANATELTLMVAGTKIGSKVTMVVIREGKELSLDVTVGERPSEEQLRPR